MQAHVDTGPQGDVTHYTFEINGPGFAVYIRDQMERRLAEQAMIDRPSRRFVRWHVGNLREDSQLTAVCASAALSI